MIWTFLIVCIGLVSAETVHPEYLSELRAAGKYEEFAKLVGIEDVELVRPSGKPRAEFTDLSSKPVSHYGDIILTKEQKEEARNHIDHRNRSLTPLLWPNGKICYSINEQDYEPHQIYFIKLAIFEINRRCAHVSFLSYQDIGRCQHYIYIFNGGGFWSFVGRIGGPQPVSVRNDVWFFQDTIIRLLWNVCGFFYEQCRCDRDNYITVHKENLTEAERYYFQQLSCDVFRAPYPYDFSSIMHFPVISSESGLRTFTPKDEDVDEDQIGYKMHLSVYDVRKMNRAYKHSEYF